MVEAVEELTARLLADESLADVATSAQNTMGVPAWASSLVGAAERRVAELEAALGLTREDVSRLRGRAEAIVTENDDLHARLADALQQRAREDDGSSPSPYGDGHSREMAERVEVVMAENALMVEQAAVVQGELERVRVEWSTAVEQSRVMGEELRVARFKLADFEQNDASRAEAHRSLEERYMAHATELASANGQLNELKEGLAGLHGQNEQLREQLTEKTRTLGEMSGRLEADGDELWGRVQAAVGRARELQEALAARTQQAEAAEESGRLAARDLETTRADNAGMLRVMGGMEKQLATYAAREESVAAVARDSKEKAENALLARDKSVAREEQAQRALEAERLARQADVEVSARARAEAVNSAGVLCSEKLRERDEEAKQRDTVVAESNAAVERHRRESDTARREARSAKDALRSLELSMLESVAELEARAKLSEERAVEAEARRELAERSLLDLRSSPTETKERRDYISAEELEEAVAASRSETARLAAKTRDLSANLASRDREVARLAKLVEEVRRDAAQQLAELNRSTDAERSRLSTGVTTARRAAEEAQAAYREQADRHRTAMVQLTSDRELSLDEAASRLQDEKAVVARLSAYDAELEARLASLASEMSHEKESNVRLAQSARARDIAAKTAERRAADLSLQLSKALADHDACLKKHFRTDYNQPHHHLLSPSS